MIPWDTAVLLPMDWQKEAMLVAPLTCQCHHCDAQGAQPQGVNRA